MNELLGNKISSLIALTRLNKPIGIFLLLWPTLWALLIASNGFPPFRITAIFILGVVLMRSAGCVINDIADRKFDGLVKRTQHRPLITGGVSIQEAGLLFFSLCFVAFLLVLQLNIFTIKLSFIGVVLAAIYPFTKRITHFPQVILGLAFAWAVPMVFAAVQNAIPLLGWLLFVIAALWPIAYDTIYALMDKEDDLKIGVRSTAIIFGKKDLLLIMLLQCFVLVLLICLGCLANLNGIFYLSVLLAFMLIGYQGYLIKRRNTASYYRAFYVNHWQGFVIFIGVLSSYIK